MIENNQSIILINHPSTIIDPSLGDILITAPLLLYIVSMLVMQTGLFVTGQYVFWHSSAHMLGEAMERLFVVVVVVDAD